MTTSGPGGSPRLADGRHAATRTVRVGNANAVRWVPIDNPFVRFLWYVRFPLEGTPRGTFGVLSGSPRDN